MNYEYKQKHLVTFKAMYNRALRYLVSIEIKEHTATQ